MIIAYNLTTGQVKKFKTVEDAHNYFKGIPIKWIERCIQTGQRYKGIVFDQT